MRPIVISLLVFVFQSPSRSQVPRGLISIDTVEIQLSLPSFVVKFINYKDYNTDPEYFRFTRLEISTLEDSVPFQVIADSSMEIYNIGFADINFDGYKDIRIDQPMTASGVNTPCDFWLFNPSAHQFQPSMPFSGLSNVEIDDSDSTFTSEANWGGRQGSHSFLYKVIARYPVLIEENSYDHDGYSNKRLVDGELIEVSAGTSEELQDPDGQWYVYIIDRELLFGELRPTSIVKKVRFPGEASKEQREFYEADITGSFLLLSRETISYSVNNKQQVVQHSKVEEVRKNKWVLINESTKVLK